MTDFAKVFNIYSTEPGEEQPDEDPTSEQIKRVNASKRKKQRKFLFIQIFIFRY
jgi:hypothetical protein